MEFDRTKKYFKVTNESENHNGYQFHDGLNVDTQEWDTKECSEGGIYFSDAIYLILVHLKYPNMEGYWIREVTIPEDEILISCEDTKIKAHSVILGPRMKLSEGATIEYLLDNLDLVEGCDIDGVKNYYKFTIYSYLGCIDDMRLLINTTKMLDIWCGNVFIGPVYYASLNGNINMMDFLIDEFIGEHKKLESFENAIKTAVYFHHIDFVKHILDKYIPIIEVSILTYCISISRFYGDHEIEALLVDFYKRNYIDKYYAYVYSSINNLMI